MHPGAINVNRGQYDAALSKWNSLHVTEYEATIEVWNYGSTWVSWKAVVGVEGTGTNAVETLKHVQSLKGFDSTHPMSEEYSYVRDTTVVQLFRLIDHLLKQPYESFVTSHGTTIGHVVKFDPTMGYPTSFALFDRWSDDPYELRIEDVKILKQSGT